MKINTLEEFFKAANANNLIYEGERSAWNINMGRNLEAFYTHFDGIAKALARGEYSLERVDGYYTATSDREGRSFVVLVEDGVIKNASNFKRIVSDDNVTLKELIKEL